MSGVLEIQWVPVLIVQPAVAAEDEPDVRVCRICHAPVHGLGGFVHDACLCSTHFERLLGKNLLGGHATPNSGDRER